MSSEGKIISSNSAPKMNNNQLTTDNIIWTKNYTWNDSDYTYKVTAYVNSKNKYRLKVLARGTADKSVYFDISTKWNNIGDEINPYVKLIYDNIIYSRKFTEIYFDILHITNLQYRNKSESQLFARFSHYTPEQGTCEYWLTCSYDFVPHVEFRYKLLSFNTLNTRANNDYTPRFPYDEGKLDIMDVYNAFKNLQLIPAYHAAADEILKHFYKHYKLKLIENLNIPRSLIDIIASYIIS